MIRISDRDRRIVSMWLAGEKAEFIACELKMWRGAVHRRVLTIGLPPRRPGKQGASRCANLYPCIVAWARAGFTAREIAVGIGCTKPDLVASIGCDTSIRFTSNNAGRSAASKRTWVSRKRQIAARVNLTAAEPTSAQDSHLT